MKKRSISSLEARGLPSEKPTRNPIITRITGKKLFSCSRKNILPSTTPPKNTNAYWRIGLIVKRARKNPARRHKMIPISIQRSKIMALLELTSFLIESSVSGLMVFVRILGVMDLLGMTAMLLLHYEVIGWPWGIIFAAYFILKGIVFG